MIPRVRLLRLLVIVTLAVAGLGGGLAAHAATTTAVLSEHGYDDPAAFVLGTDSSPLRLACRATVFDAHPHDLGTLSSPEWAGVAAKAGAEVGTDLVVLNPLSQHAIERMAERGITRGQVDAAIRKGTQYYDRRNGTISHVLEGGFASGKTLLVGTNPSTGLVTVPLHEIWQGGYFRAPDLTEHSDGTSCCSLC